MKRAAPGWNPDAALNSLERGTEEGLSIMASRPQETPDSEIDVAAVLKRLNEHKAASQKSWTDLALSIGMPTGTLSSFATGNYKGNNQRLAHEIERWFAAEEKQQLLMAESGEGDSARAERGGGSRTSKLVTPSPRAALRASLALSREGRGKFNSVPTPDRAPCPSPRPPAWDNRWYSAARGFPSSRGPSGR